MDLKSIKDKKNDSTPQQMYMYLDILSIVKTLLNFQINLYLSDIHYFYI